MIVKGPATDGHRVLRLAVLSLEIVLGEEVIADQPAVLAFACRNPIQSIAQFAVSGWLPESSRNPRRRGRSRELEPDAFVVADGVELAAPLDPPVAIVPGADRRNRSISWVTWRASAAAERHGASVIAGGEEDAAAEGLAVAGGWASDSLNSLLGSRPQRVSAPASRASRLSPVQSRKSRE